MLIFRKNSRKLLLLVISKTFAKCVSCVAMPYDCVSLYQEQDGPDLPWFVDVSTPTVFVQSDIIFKTVSTYSTLWIAQKQFLTHSLCAVHDHVDTYEFYCLLPCKSL